MRARLLIVISLIAGAFMLIPAASTAAAPPAPTCGPYVTLTPPFGTPGTQVSVNLFQYPPNDEVSVILRVPGNPVVGTGTTDEYGHANIMITMQDFDGDQVAVFAQASPCYAAGAYFRYQEVTPTASPTPIQVTATPTATVPGQTPSTPATPSPTAPVVTNTPQPPIAGSGSGGINGSGMNLAIVGLVLVMFCGAFALWGSTRKLQAVRIESRDRRDDDS